MSTTRTSSALPITAAVVLAITTFPAAPAFADESGSSGRTLLSANLVGSMPAPASPLVAGVAPGGAPWVAGPSPVRVRQDGRMTVTVRRLVIPPPTLPNTNPVPSVVATLVCADMVKASTKPFALDMAGNGKTTDMIAVPAKCDAPVVLIQPARNRTAYIAATVGKAAPVRR